MLARVLAAVVVVGGLGVIAAAGLRSNSESRPIDVATSDLQSDNPADTPAPDGSAASTTSSEPPLVPVEDTQSDPIPRLGEARDLILIDDWLNTDLESLDEIRASNDVIVVQFWTFGCHNCKATLPYLQELYASYKDSGLEIVGVHSPEFSYEEDPDNVAQALIDLEVTWPVALDTNLRNFFGWQDGRTSYWPRTYVIDSDREIRFDHIGEGAYDELFDVVDRLLAESA